MLKHLKNHHMSSVFMCATGCLRPFGNTTLNTVLQNANYCDEFTNVYVFRVRKRNWPRF